MMLVIFILIIKDKRRKFVSTISKIYSDHCLVELLTDDFVSLGPGIETPLKWNSIF